MKRDPLPAAVSIDPRGVPLVWRFPLFALGLSLTAITLCFFGTAVAMVRIWARSDTFAHGFVVVPISLWLIWRMRARLVEFTPKATPLFLPLLAASGLVWLVGEVAAVNALAQFAFIAMLVLAVPTMLGIAVTRRMLFPLIFLFFAVPFGEFLMPVLMTRTADFTVAALRLTGIPVYREGLQFVIPSGRWSVVEACSGIRYLISSIVVGTLFAYISFSSWRKRAVFVAIAMAVPILANWVRAYMIVLLGHLSGNRLATGVDHLVYGWVFFGVVMLVMFGIGSSFRDPMDPSVVTRGDRAIATVTLRSRNWQAAGAAIGIVLSSLLWSFVDRGIASRDGSASLAPVQVPGWRHVDASASAFTPTFEQPSAVYQDEVAKSGSRVGLFIAYYRAQNVERKLVSSSNVLVRSDDHAWNTIANDLRSVELGHSTTDVNTVRLRGATGEVLTAWQWYWVDGALTASGALAKARIAWHVLTGRADDSAAIVVYTRSDEGGAARSDAILQEFVADAWPAILAVLEQASSRP